MATSTGERNCPIGGKVFFSRYAFRKNCDLFLAKIRGEPRFKKLMERVK
jgi:hypothetical protein